MPSNNLFGIPHILFALGSDPNFEDAKSILREANQWIADNPTSQYHPAVLSARNRLGKRVANHFLEYIIELNRLKRNQCPVPVCGDEPTEGWSPE